MYLLITIVMFYFKYTDLRKNWTILSFIYFKIFDLDYDAKNLININFILSLISFV